MQRILIILSLALFGFVSAQCQPPVKFKGKSAVELSGKIFKPEGKGPFPAVIMMHGCEGVTYIYDNWAEYIKSLGYVVFVLDSFSERGVHSVCHGLDLTPTMQDRVKDAFDAKDYISSLSYVDKNKIGLIGWSHGAVSALIVALRSKDWPTGDIKPFTAVATFYPFCFAVKEDFSLTSPLLILIGERDDWTPAKLCVDYDKKMKEKQQDITLKVYPKATHAFDFEGIDTFVNGHKITHDPDAQKDAKQQLKQFFGKHLKK